MPPPPPGRVHASSWNFWPSSSSTAAHDLVLRGADHLLEARAHGVGVVLAALAEEGEGSLVDGNFLLDAHRADRD